MVKAGFFPLMGIVLLLLAISERPAEAYIDPGTASYVFQVIAGAILGGVAVAIMSATNPRSFTK